MSSGSIAQQATRHVQRTLLWTLGAAGALAGASVVAVFVLASANEGATQRLIDAQQSADTVLLADERLTMSAHMAAATGEESWIARYDANIPMIDGAIAKAASLAASDVATRFDSETRVANDELVALEAATFDAVRAGDLAKAREILASQGYRRNKEILSEGAGRFTRSVIGAERRNQAMVQAMVGIAPFLLMLAVIAGVALLWRRLARILRGAEHAINDAEGVIRDMSANDALTGIANRAALAEHIKSAVERAGNARTKVALLMLDIDGFRAVNDAHGMATGDLALKEVTRRICELLRQGEFRARYGGDEFVTVMEFASEDAARRLAHRMVEALCQPMQVLDAQVFLHASVGVALFPNMARDAEDMLCKAELALTRAKRDQRGAVRVYDLTMDVELHEREELENSLRAAVKTPALTPFFQPILDLRSNEVIGLEILARWRHETRGLIQPQDFLPTAANAGLLNDITGTILRSACVAAHCMPGKPSLWLNVAPQQMQSEWLSDKVRMTLKETGFPAERLTVEITDTSLMTDLAAAKKVIGALKAQGVRVALDNFGVGYSSLNYLAEIPFDSIKISSAFVRKLSERGDSAKIVAAMVSLARSLGAISVAECVEKEEQAALLRAMGCDAAQGFYFAKPMSGAEAAMALAARPDRDERAIA